MGLEATEIDSVFHFHEVRAAGRIAQAFFKHLSCGVGVDVHHIAERKRPSVNPSMPGFLPDVDGLVARNDKRDVGGSPDHAADLVAPIKAGVENSRRV